jgi:O-acetyl-ADP-ribose deacetylase (regulator of RNase III)
MIDTRISVVTGDITSIIADAIVNAANNSLAGGGGVDGAIRRAAGPQLQEACKKTGGCRTGEAVITPGYKLPAKYVIHTVGPVWHGGNNHEDELLSSCYRNCLEAAVRRAIKSVAFPAISTGAYGFPPDRAAIIAVNEVKIFLSTHPEIEKVTFVCYSQKTYDLYNQYLHP